MTDKKSKKDSPKMDQVLADIARNRKLRENTYRARALKMFPWVCGRCTREFSEKKVRELTVHHKDHDHDNNPPDGSNWELLCIYCHDYEHSKYTDADYYGVTEVEEKEEPPSETFKAFAGLEALLNKKKV